MFLLEPIYLPGHPGNYLFLLWKNTFAASKYPKNICSSFENTISACTAASPRHCHVCAEEFLVMLAQVIMRSQSYIRIPCNVGTGHYEITELHPSQVASNRSC